MSIEVVIMERIRTVKLIDEADFTVRITVKMIISILSAATVVVYYSHSGNKD